MNFRLRKAFDSDIEKIKPYAEKLNLDTKDMNPRKFYIVSNNGQIAGFGRKKNYKNICEFATIGVFEEYRDFGIGEMIVNKLIETASGEEIWLTTVIPEYFNKFGFKMSNNAPEELILKAQRICKRFGKPIENNVFMRLETL